MKTLRNAIVIALVVFGFNQANAQNADANITLTKVIEASADDVWYELRKLDNIDEISSFVAKVEFKGPKGVGGSRICTAPDGQGKFKENILAYDDTNRTYTYAVVEGIPAAGMVNNFKVVDLGYQKSMIVWTSSYDKFMKNPQMTEEQFNGFLNQASTEMMVNIAQAASK
ncbi:SRPBCC family protein [Aquimarina sp. U1-2]|uniref:SRPBCC family protein n=1 Tax=Aquimarina sp. U1-2 TaxID=2823141 RepID=UPI001AECD35B|nr:SRPBCC family protein [Aquimarina sp. U1-2]MBP2831518.1 SRPBCC family protein [Aquimarina sp. U1-2]